MYCSVLCTVQVWWYWLETLRHELWASLPPSLAASLLCSVLSSSLGLLAHRYSALRPAPARLAQYRADLTAVLLGAGQLVPGLASCQLQLRSVHAKCELLAALLVMVTSPAPPLLAGTQPGPAPRPGSWQQLVCGPASQLQLVTSSPGPEWAQLVALWLEADCALPRALLAQLGGQLVTPGELVPAGGSCGPAPPSWPVLVVGGALLCALHRPSCVRPLAASLGPAPPPCSPRPRLPVWEAALALLLRPHLAPALADLLRTLDTLDTLDTAPPIMVRALSSQLVADLAQLVATLPAPLAQLLLRLGRGPQLVLGAAAWQLQLVVARQLAGPPAALLAALCSALPQLEGEEVAALHSALQQLDTAQPEHTAEIIALNILQGDENKVFMTALYRWCQYVLLLKPTKKLVKVPIAHIARFRMVKL